LLIQLSTQGKSSHFNNPGKGKEPSPNKNIRPPFEDNFAESSQNNVEDEEDINIVMGIDERNTIFLTQED
ncbi:hypothetical protein, partial [Bacteroides uniformis]|uniref:hypothetical protein n=1 Tax=Bacteroides uniformis TaxID=820 RepID=UPI001AA15949